MITIAFQFLAGRFHATPWGRHVNEGAVEWPPSPWRILRALIAAWKRTLPELDVAQVKPIFQQLLAPPEFLLPPASTGHTRHYSPWYKKGPDDRTLIFDTFVVVPPTEQLLVCWPNATLSESQWALLEQILQNLNTLGRSESWCQASLVSSNGHATDQHTSDAYWVKPLHGQTLPDDHEIVRLLCPDPDTALADDHVVCKPTKGGGRSKSKQAQGLVLYDPAWNICMETLQLHQERWSDPPGSRWVCYARPRHCFQVKPIRRHPDSSDRPQVARFVLDSIVLPLVTETLSVAEAARRTLMGIFGRLFPTPDGAKGRSQVFAGKAPDGTPLKEHRHTYYLPTDEDFDGRLDHLTLVAEDGFGPQELEALQALRSLNLADPKQQRYPLRVVLLGWGRLDDYLPGPLMPATGEPEQGKANRRRSVPMPLMPAKTWLSVTPFLAPRFPKANGTKRDPPELLRCLVNFLQAALAEELQRLLARRPDLAGIRLDEIHITPCLDSQGVFRISTPVSRVGLRPIQFRRCRSKATDDGTHRRSGAFQIQFPREVRGPIALGHSSHFGMGLFLPKAD